MSEPVPASAGEQTALAQRLFVQHSSQLRGFITALSPDLALADDVFQETFLTVTAKAADFDANRDFLPWACGIARLKLMELGRKASRQGRPLSDEVLEALSASEPPPESEDERLKHLAECVKSLAPQSRRIVEMCYQEAHKPAEIARRMEWNAESVYVALSRARTALRECVERKLVDRGETA